VAPAEAQSDDEINDSGVVVEEATTLTSAVKSVPDAAADSAAKDLSGGGAKSSTLQQHIDVINDFLRLFIPAVTSILFSTFSSINVG